MKYIFIFILSFYCSQIFTQTYIGPVLGMDFARVESVPNNAYGLEILDKGFTISSITIGIKIEQKIYKTLYFAYHGEYSKKEFEAIDYAEYPIKGIKFDYFRNKFSLKYLFKDMLYLGLGFNYNFINKVRFLDFPCSYHNAGNSTELGVHYLIGFKYKKFDLELYFINALSSKASEKYPALYIRPLSSFGLNFSYDIKIFNSPKFNGSKDCPTF